MADAVQRRRSISLKQHLPKCPRRLVVAFVALTSACNDAAKLNAPSVAASAQDVRRYVVGNAKAQLDKSGTFVVPVDSKLPRPSITRDRAIQLGSQFALEFGPLLRPSLERDRGAPIDFAHLNPCGRVFYAASPVPDLPEGATDVARREYGPWWLVALCDARGEAVSVATSAYATEVQVVDGHLQFPLFHGAEFWMIGVPEHLRVLPLSPEEAVVAVSTRTGALVPEVPVLTAPMPRDGVPQMSRWEVKLDRPVTVRGASTHTISVQSELSVRRASFREDLIAEIPSADQPLNLSIRFWIAPRVGQLSSTSRIRTAPEAPLKAKSLTPREGSVLVAMKPQYYTKFERVDVVGGH